MRYFDITVQEVGHLLESVDTQVIDIRDEQSYRSGHISGAVQSSDAVIRKLVQNRKNNHPVLIYCYHGNSSRELASFLAGIGLQQVYNLVGGWEAWSKHQQALDTALPESLSSWMEQQGFDPRNPNDRIENGMSPVMMAVLEQELEILQALIEYQADLNLVNDDENNALWFACFKDNLEIIDLLIQQGIRIDHQNSNGATSLIYAASAGKYEVVRALVQAGADTRKVTLDGFTALDSAATLPILKFLKPLTIAA